MGAGAWWDVKAWADEPVSTHVQKQGIIIHLLFLCVLCVGWIHMGDVGFDLLNIRFCLYWRRLSFIDIKITVV